METTRPLKPLGPSSSGGASGFDSWHHTDIYRRRLPSGSGEKGAETHMPIYMSQFSYTPEAWAALARQPEDRSEAIGGQLESLGGQLISFYYSFGDYDGVIIAEAPDETTIATALVAAVAAGHLKTLKTTTLLS